MKELYKRLKSKKLRPKWKKPNQTYLYIYGCKAFTIIKQAQKNIERIDRFKLRA